MHDLRSPDDETLLQKQQQLLLLSNCSYQSIGDAVMLVMKCFVRSSFGGTLHAPGSFVSFYTLFNVL